MAKERLDKIVSHLGIASRRECAMLVRAKRITCDGVVASSADCKVDPGQSVICIDGKAITYRKHWYIMMHKPAGVITATHDRIHQTVLDLLPLEIQKAGVFAVGRLDKDTQGLLLLTTDGDFSHRLMAPGKHVPKRYIATIEGTLAPNAIAQFAKGITLADGTVCKPAQLNPLDAQTVEMVLCEGKYHQVKRMIAAVGGHVTHLRRTQIGALCLDETLPQGGWRELTEQECQQALAQEF